MKKVLIGLITILIVLGGAGYVKGYVPNTPAYKERIAHEELMAGLNKLDEMSEKINGKYVSEYMTRDKAVAMQDEWVKVCLDLKENSSGDEESKAVDSICSSLVGNIMTIESFSSNNGSEDIGANQLVVIKEMAKGVDSDAKNFMRVSNDEDAVKFVEKKFSMYSDRF
ncbi:hypothetical protein [Exiguobacterium sp. s133]|uniref:hypothetical protein n=1 Tax=Exiguobacterium sp. s133 TaxID=2751213 RepID=UPI001BE868A7|nr:hypothetical protein [Exiguobacterium sp. s133]